MEFTSEFIEQQGLSEEQVKGITSFTQEQFATKQKEWDGLANKNAEGIINGAINSIQKQFGTELKREEGEKAADYLTRFSSTVVSGKQSELEILKSDYETKIKGVKGSETLSKEYEAMKTEREEILKKYADYDTLKEKAEKADVYGQELSQLNLQVAYGNVKPSFPAEANKFEVDAKWNAFIEDVNKDYIIKVIDGKSKAIDKKNEFNIIDLNEIVLKDTNIQGLLKGRQQEGTGAKQVDLKSVDGVPFKVPVNADGKTRSKLIKEHLASKGIDNMHNDYSSKFAELNKTILQGQTQVA